MHEDTAPDQGPGAETADGDYGYDLAHEAMGEAGTSARPESRPEPTRSEPKLDDSSGDYGYDLAHDMRSP